MQPNKRKNRKTMSIPRILMVLAILWAALAGCRGEMVPLTQAICQAFASYIPEIQVYNSREIFLVRTVKSEEKQVLDGGSNIQINKEMVIQSITIPAYTPGVIAAMDGDTFWVQFEPTSGEAARVIPFTLRLSAQEDGGPREAIYVFDGEEIEYDGNRYKVTYEEGSAPVKQTDGAVYATGDEVQGPAQYIATRFYPYLMIHPVEEFARLEKKNRVVKGLRVKKSS